MFDFMVCDWCCVCVDWGGWFIYFVCVDSVNVYMFGYLVIIYYVVLFILCGICGWLLWL